MVDHTPEYAPIVQRAIAAYEGLMELYAQDAPTNVYFDNSLSEARKHRNGLRERLGNPIYLADAFQDNFFQSIDHFLDSHRGEYGSDMPGSDPGKAQRAGQYLQALRGVMEDMIRIETAQEAGS